MAKDTGIEDQAVADRRVPRRLSVPAVVHFLRSGAMSLPKRRAKMTEVIDPRADVMTTTLTMLATAIADEHRQATEHATSAILHAMAAGDLLLKAKERLPHGAWLPWLADSCALSERTAQRYMALARHRATLEAKAPRVADLNVRQAMALLAVSPSSPPDGSSVPPDSLPLIDQPNVADAPIAEAPTPMRARNGRAPARIVDADEQRKAREIEAQMAVYEVVIKLRRIIKDGTRENFQLATLFSATRFANSPPVQTAITWQPFFKAASNELSVSSVLPE